MLMLLRIGESFSMRRLGDFLLRAGIAAGLLTLVSSGAAPAYADCYEDIG